MLEERKQFFFEKKNQKTFLFRSRELPPPVAQNKRSLFASFSSEKEGLT